MTNEQKMWFALLGADIDMFEKYMIQSEGCTYRSIRALNKYDNLPDTAWEWAVEQGFLDLTIEAA